MERGVRYPGRLQGAHADHRVRADPHEFPGVCLLRPDRPHLHPPGPHVETDPARRDHQLRLQPQPECLGRRYCHALSAVLTTRCKQSQHCENPRPEPGHQLVWLHGDCRRGVQQRSGAHADRLDTQQRRAARGGRVAAAGKCGLSGRVPVLHPPGMGHSRCGNQLAVTAHGHPATGPRGLELVVDGGGDFHPAAEQTGLSAGAWRATDQRHRRGNHPHPGRPRCTGGRVRGAAAT